MNIPAKSQSTFWLEVLTATDFFPFSLLPREQLSTRNPTYSMCSRSRYAACMPMGGSSQLRLLQVAEHLTLFKECRS